MVLSARHAGCPAASAARRRKNAGKKNGILSPGTDTAPKMFPASGNAGAAAEAAILRRPVRPLPSVSRRIRGRRRFEAQPPIPFPPCPRERPAQRHLAVWRGKIPAAHAWAPCCAERSPRPRRSPRRTRAGSLFSRASPFRHAGLHFRRTRHGACLTGQPRASAGLRARHARGGHFAAVQPNCRLLFHPYPPQETAHLRRVSF